MISTIRNIKKLFGINDEEYEYWVRLCDIKVPTAYKLTRVGKEKWNHKMSYWLKTGEFESPILLHRDFRLADGFSSVKIAYLKELDKVPVYFVD